jgi:oligopeptide/dipeptide ABC transporter ATP-binding protein
MAKHLLSVKNLTKYYPQHTVKTEGGYPPVKAVDGISFELNQGQVLGIIGESGCGKSTLGRVLIQLEQQTGGEINMCGKNAAEWQKKSPGEFKRTAQIVFQNPYDTFNPRFTILKSMMRPLIIHSIGASDAQRREICLAALESAGLSPAEDYLNRFPHELSGGQLQRISILRAMMLKPAFLVADEPVSMLDVSVRAEVLNLLSRLVRENNMAMVFISHDIATTRYIANRVAVMYLGRIVESGPTDLVLHHPMHPYTQALLSNCGSLDMSGAHEPIAIQGEPPVPIGAGPGCYFAPRCFKTCPKCWAAYPETVGLGEDHLADCCMIDTSDDHKEEHQ